MFGQDSVLLLEVENLKWNTANWSQGIDDTESLKAAKARQMERWWEDIDAAIQNLVEASDAKQMILGPSSQPPSWWSPNWRLGSCTRNQDRAVSRHQTGCLVARALPSHRNCTELGDLSTVRTGWSRTRRLDTWLSTQEVLHSQRRSTRCSRNWYTYPRTRGGIGGTRGIRGGDRSRPEIYKRMTDVSS